MFFEYVIKSVWKRVCGSKVVLLKIILKCLEVIFIKGKAINTNNFDAQSVCFSNKYHKLNG